MRVALDWESTYRYSEPVRLLHTELRVQPADGFGQQLVNSSLTMEPEATMQPLVDMFGNNYQHADFLEEVDHLTVSVQAEVETELTTEGHHPAEEQISPLLRHLYLASTARSPQGDPITALTESIPANLDPVSTGGALCQLIGERFTFEVGSTDVAATALDLLELERGVCQDFSHLMLGALRQRGIPARYVSGYLAPSQGEDSAEASHAWIQLLFDDQWYGFDPANDTVQDGRYVVTAVGRDYDDVPPIRGTFAGLASQEWKTKLRVRSGGAQQ
jgi:transglutaminase-like putative cysteine protease